MSRFAEVIVLARGAESVMLPLTVPDDSREWWQCFVPIDDSILAGSGAGSSECYAWVIQFYRHNWRNLLAQLESLRWRTLSRCRCLSTTRRIPASDCG